MGTNSDGTRHFDFYGLGVCVQGDSKAFVDAVVRDFRFFCRDDGSSCARTTANVRVEGYRRPPEFDGLPDIPAAFLTPRNVCFKEGHTSYIDYFGKALGVLDRKSRIYRIYSDDDDLLHEACYLFLLSTVGEHLDRRGLHRVHALGVTYRDKAVLLLLPSGGGKSTMALELLSREGFKLLAEDTPLIDAAGRVYPFTLRIGVRPESVPDIPREYLHTMRRMEFDPKTIIDIEYFRDRLATDTAEPAAVLVGQRNLGRISSIEPISFVEGMRAMTKYAIVGIGVYQGLEFILERGLSDLRGKLGTVLARGRASVRLLRRSQTYRFVLGRDTERNMQTLLEFLEHAIH